MLQVTELVQPSISVWYSDTIQIPDFKVGYGVQFSEGHVKPKHS